MEKAEFHTNYVRGNKTLIEEVETALNDGMAVRIGANCIGHTRAAMVQYEAEKLFEELGAKVVIEDPIWGNFYGKVV